MAAVLRVRARAMSTLSPLDVPWALLRSKMGTDQGKAQADAARDAFNRRLTAARAGSAAPAEIDWAGYGKALPSLDVAKLRADYERFAKAIPAIKYDAAADVAAHAKSETAWAGFETYCRGKVAELTALQAEQQDHKLHRWYRRARVWQRFPGLYQSIHHRVRGTWENGLWADYINYKARATPLPWNEAAVAPAPDEAKKREMLEAIAAKSGLSKKQVGLE